MSVLPWDGRNQFSNVFIQDTIFALGLIKRQISKLTEWRGVENSALLEDQTPSQSAHDAEGSSRIADFRFTASVAKRLLDFHIFTLTHECSPNHTKILGRKQMSVMHSNLRTQMRKLSHKLIPQILRRCWCKLSRYSSSRSWKLRIVIAAQFAVDSLRSTRRLCLMLYMCHSKVQTKNINILEHQLCMKSHDIWNWNSSPRKSLHIRAIPKFRKFIRILGRVFVRNNKRVEKGFIEE